MALVDQYKLNYWLAEHISILWLLQHPLISILGLMIGLVLFSRLLMAIAMLIDRLWLWILRLPITLFKSIFVSRDNSSNNDVAPAINYELTTNADKFEQILQKLQVIEQQQKKILQELAVKKNSDYMKQNNQPKLVKQIKDQC